VLLLHCSYSEPTEFVCLRKSMKTLSQNSRPLEREWNPVRHKYGTAVLTAMFICRLLVAQKWCRWVVNPINPLLYEPFMQASRTSSVSIVTRLQAKRLGSDSRKRQAIFFPSSPRPYRLWDPSSNPFNEYRGFVIWE
jgi:hypothetical protein